MKNELRSRVEELADAYRSGGGDLSSAEWRETVLPGAVWDHFAECGGLTEGGRAFLAELGLSETLDFEGNDHDA